MTQLKIIVEGGFEDRCNKLCKSIKRVDRRKREDVKDFNKDNGPYWKGEEVEVEILRWVRSSYLQ